MATRITDRLVLAAAGQTEYSRLSPVRGAQSILVTVTVVALTAPDQLDVTLQGGNDGQNWYPMTTSTFVAAGNGPVGPVAGPGYLYCRMKYVFTSGGSGNPCIVSATLEAKQLVTGASAPPAPPV